MAKKIDGLIKRARAIRLVAMDVDGVLTGGEVIVLESGEEVKFWNAKDRLCMALIRDRGYPVKLAWITGRESHAVTRAAADLGIVDVVQKCHDKKAALKSILDKHGLAASQAAFIGDDLLDLGVLRSVGFSACPADAVRDVRKDVHYMSPVAGGRGVVQDVLEFILRAQNKWESLVASLAS